MTQTQPQPPILTGQHIGQAHYATRALLESSLAEAGLPFASWLMASFIATAGPVVTEAAAIERITGGLKVDDAAARTALDDLITKGYVHRATDTSEPSVQLTDTGDALVRQLLAATSGIADRLYGDLSPADLETARRVLETVTARANAELGAHV
jgi:DNA-binding MarR family transcriptional regulator